MQSGIRRPGSSGTFFKAVAAQEPGMWAYVIPLRPNSEVKVRPL